MRVDAPDGPFRMVQISDCHLSASRPTLYRGEDADAGLKKLLHRIAAWRPQLVLATGDLSEDASAASYQRLAQYLQLVDAPVCALPGNHDDDRVMQQFFQDGPWQGPCIRQAGDWRLVLLKSAQAGRIDGSISPADIQAVRQWLDEGPRRPVLLALHHQPVPVGSTWIDRYSLEAPEALLKLVEEQQLIRGVVWGHVHQAFETRLDNARLLACPSTAANSRPATSRFVLDPTGPSCRWLKLHAHGRIETGLMFAA